MALTTLAGMVFVLSKKVDYDQKTRSWLIALLLFVVFILSSGTSLFSYLTLDKTPVLSLYKDHMMIGSEKVPYANVKQVKIEKGEQTSFVNPSVVTKKYQFLLIELVGGKTYAFSERNYPVNEVLGELKKITRQ